MCEHNCVFHFKVFDPRVHKNMIRNKKIEGLDFIIDMFLTSWRGAGCAPRKSVCFALVLAWKESAPRPASPSTQRALSDRETAWAIFPLLIPITTTAALFTSRARGANTLPIKTTTTTTSTYIQHEKLLSGTLSIKIASDIKVQGRRLGLYNY